MDAHLVGESTMQNLEQLYEKAGDLHGNICGGVVLGVRMALLGCRMIDLDEPQRFENRKKLMVLAETDRCATDGIQTVTGCTLGKRTLRVMDYGIMAATFINLDPYLRFSFIAGAIARMIQNLPWPWKDLYSGMWIGHATVAAFFFIYFPFSKLIHVFVTPLGRSVTMAEGYVKQKRGKISGGLL